MTSFVFRTPMGVKIVERDCERTRSAVDSTADEIRNELISQLRQNNPPLYAGEEQQVEFRYVWPLI